MQNDTPITILQSLSKFRDRQDTTSFFSDWHCVPSISRLPLYPIHDYMTHYAVYLHVPPSVLCTCILHHEKKEITESMISLNAYIVRLCDSTLMEFEWDLRMIGQQVKMVALAKHVLAHPSFCVVKAFLDSIDLIVVNKLELINARIYEAVANNGELRRVQQGFNGGLGCPCNSAPRIDMFYWCLSYNRSLLPAHAYLCLLTGMDHRSGHPAPTSHSSPPFIPLCI